MGQQVWPQLKQMFPHVGAEVWGSLGCLRLLLHTCPCGHAHSSSLLFCLTLGLSLVELWAVACYFLSCIFRWLLKAFFSYRFWGLLIQTLWPVLMYDFTGRRRETREGGWQSNQNALHTYIKLWKHFNLIEKRKDASSKDIGGKWLRKTPAINLWPPYEHIMCTHVHTHTHAHAYTHVYSGH